MNRIDAESETLIAGTLKSNNGGGGFGSDPSETLIASTLSTRYGASSGQDLNQDCMLIAFDTTQITSAVNRSNPQPGDPCHTLAKGAGADAPAVAFTWQGGTGFSQTDGYSGNLTKNQTMAVAVANNLNGNSGRMQIEQTYVPTTMAVRRLLPIECERLQGFPDDFTKIPLRQRRKAKRHDARVNEFLVDAADGPRYKALGNSMAVPVLRWIAERLKG